MTTPTPEEDEARTLDDLKFAEKRIADELWKAIRQGRRMRENGLSAPKAPGVYNNFRQIGWRFEDIGRYVLKIAPEYDWEHDGELPRPRFEPTGKTIWYKICNIFVRK